MLPLLDLPAASVLTRLQRWQIQGSARLEQAVILAEKLYRGREHWTGVSLLDHVLGVLEVLQPFRPDEDTVIACLLQHSLATHAFSLSELEEEFGSSVRSLVSSVHLLSHVTKRTRQSSVDDLRLMLLSVSDDMRVLLLILCERCSVLPALHRISVSERRQVCRDILNLYAPVAARLGIHSLKQRMENLSFPIVYPLDAEWITEQLRQLQGRHGSFLSSASEHMRAALREQGIASDVHGREKLPYSIFMKMKAKSRSSVDSLPDLFALRVIVATEEDCYRVLGILHRLGRPITNRFKDYIAFPKPNGYRSLHTTITRLPGVPDGVLVEVQIRTHSMHTEAEYGVAAHWSYKEGGTAQNALQRVALQQVLTSQQTIAGKGKMSSLVDHIFVLTPKGDIIELPEGATPLDFAFQIHTTLGLGFRAARVNGRIVSMEYELENGDIVDILTHSSPQPSTEWLTLLKMASSRSRLRRYLHTFHRDEYVARGRVMFNEELRKRHLPPLDADLTILRKIDGATLTIVEREEVLAKIAQGADRLSLILTRVDALTPLLVPVPPTPSKRFQRKDAIVEVDGGVPMPIRFAKCCNPQEQNRPRIVGIISRRGEVAVHAAKCRMVLKGNPERRIGVRWKKNDQ
jgi:GTP pyrophosphokinase